MNNTTCNSDNRLDSKLAIHKRLELDSKLAIYKWLGSKISNPIKLEAEYNWQDNQNV